MADWPRPQQRHCHQRRCPAAVSSKTLRSQPERGHGQMSSYYTPCSRSEDPLTLPSRSARWLAKCENDRIARFSEVPCRVLIALLSVARASTPAMLTTRNREMTPPLWANSSSKPRHDRELVGPKAVRDADFDAKPLLNRDKQASIVGACEAGPDAMTQPEGQRSAGRCDCVRLAGVLFGHETTHLCTGDSRNVMASCWVLDHLERFV